jgi:hypothetical protein
VAHEAGAARPAAVAPEFHEVDTPSRRIGFLSPEHVGRTRRETEAAVDAVVEQISAG